jgi:galactokinase
VSSRPDLVEVRVHAPGRVNLIGDHTDYAGGLALPMAIDLGTTIVGRRGGSSVRLTSEGFDGAAQVSLPRPVPGPVDPVDPVDAAEADRTGPGWVDYVSAVIDQIRPAAGFAGRISTSLPVGAGLSSSAALEVAVALALGADLEPLALAQACQRAEQLASGTPCGLMDQLCSVAGEADHALLIDFRAITWTPVALPDGLTVVVIHSGVARQLAGSRYGQRRAEVEAAAARLGPLRDAGLEDVARLDDPVLASRARHVVSENARVLAFVDALADRNLAAAGALINQSHASLRDDFAASTPEVDQLVDQLVATPGVHGARMVGGGFGGCVVALTDPGALDQGWTVTASAGARVAPLTTLRP